MTGPTGLRDLRDELARMDHPVALGIRHRLKRVTGPEEGQAHRVSVVMWAGPCPVRIVLASA